LQQGKPTNSRSVFCAEETARQWQLVCRGGAVTMDRLRGAAAKIRKKKRNPTSKYACGISSTD